MALGSEPSWTATIVADPRNAGPGGGNRNSGIGVQQPQKRE
jgi:hypothetical protein